ncbi:hypothetical protein PISMIDRAFT_483660 [Pisolithus microcarpus 441]|uniref:Uncharacterized protein n=1 Tax=Pisolithus microcarpus 441 TaxID=765257 RepID=A0A0D0ABW8_9AGAM|nr:hypothetical protein PISMIDRAFT_483660 [Pisolithus microcarpus 441]
MASTTMAAAHAPIMSATKITPSSPRPSLSSDAAHPRPSITHLTWQSISLPQVHIPSHTRTRSPRLLPYPTESHPTVTSYTRRPIHSRFCFSTLPFHSRSFVHPPINATPSCPSSSCPGSFVGLALRFVDHPSVVSVDPARFSCQSL